MINSSKHASRRVGFWLAMTAVLFVVGWRLCVIACQPAHLLAIATEVGSIADSKEGLNTEELVPSSDGHGLVFFQETETGLGSYFWETAGGKSKLLLERKEKGYDAGPGMLAWSPEDRFFAYAVPSRLDPVRQSDIIIYDGISGEPVAKIEARRDSEFIWLSPHSFAYSTYNQAWLVFG